MSDAGDTASSHRPRPEAPAGLAPTAAARGPFLVALTGNPNCGKTTVFNSLTGLRAKVGNYAGVTVERREGRLQGAAAGQAVTVLDLPGSYSLSPQSLDEQIARDVLFQRLPEVPAPDLVVVVVDASNLERNLYYATQVLELGYPTLIALNMMDVARDNGHAVDVERLGPLLGVPVFPLVANVGEGLPALRNALLAFSQSRPARRPAPGFCEPAAAFQQEARVLAAELAQRFPDRGVRALAESLLILSDEENLRRNLDHYGPEVAQTVLAARARLEAAGVDWRSAPIEARYARVAGIQQAVVTETLAVQETVSDRLDRILTDRVWGVLIFVGLMAMMFQSIFTFARLPMNALEAGVGWVGAGLARLLPPGDLQSLLVDGVVAGVGAVVVFLPQICLLFLFIGLLEDTGYMARAAFLMDRLMSKVGLHGKSFIPMLSSFACAIPGIMATRTIETPKDRLVTILVAPLMSCSARLPVYTLLIAACLPERRVLGFFRLSGLTMLGMYLLGITMALVMAWVFKQTLLKGRTPMLIMELPPYKRPLARVILRHMWDRALLFLRKAGTVILGINILLWFLATYPRDAATEAKYDLRRQQVMAAARLAGQVPAPDASVHQTALAQLDAERAGERVRHSFAGRLGRALEPLIKPLGFDWKIGIGIISSFAAREVFVSTLSVVYNVGGAPDPESAARTLAQTLRAQTRENGTPVYTTRTGLTLMVFYVLALQCASTVAIVRRETNSWKWPAFQWAYMGALAWLMAFLASHAARLLGCP